MVDRVVQRDGLAIDVDRVRQIHVAAERPAHALGDDRLAVSGRPVQEDRFSGVDGGAKLVEHVVFDDQMREAAAQPLAIDVAPRCLQRLHRRDVGRQRHGRRPDVLVGLEILLCAIAPQIRQRVPIPGRARSCRTLHFDEPLDPDNVLDDRFEIHRRKIHSLQQRQAMGNFLSVVHTGFL